MNCKPGDLAMYVGNAGPMGFPVNVIRRDKDWIGFACWRVDPPVPDLPGVLITGLADVIMDKDLRPIRPGSGDDETLTWAGKPVETVHNLPKVTETQ